MKINTEKELFDFIRNINLKNIPTLKSILNRYSINKININDLLNILPDKSDRLILLIDARSEKEFDESSLPLSLNFPVLNNSERHNTGLIYKKYSQTAALWLAMQYADSKVNCLSRFLLKNNADEKNIVVYCWRGGGRSGYLSKMISDLGYNVTTLEGGQKVFRKVVNDFFSINKFPFPLIELSGLTGCGKSELLENISGTLPVINLELAARHCSSLLGHIPYLLKNFLPVRNQSAFENNIFSEIILSGAFSHDKNLKTFLVESESKKVGDFRVPENIYLKILNAPSIKIISSLENRVRRIVLEYFGKELDGLELVKMKMAEKKNFFCQQLSTKSYNELMRLLDLNRVFDFSELMLTKYYDKKYKDKGKKHSAEICTDNMHTANEELKFFYKKLTASN